MQHRNPDYHLIRLDTPPRIYYVTFRNHEHLQRKYLRTEDFMMELSFQQEGTIYEVYDGNTQAYTQHSVRTTLFNAEREIYTDSPATSSFSLVFRLDNPPLPLSDTDVARWSSSSEHAIIPTHVTNPAVCERIGILLKAAHRLVVNNDPICHLKLRTIFHECLTILSEQAISHAERRLQHTSRIQSPYTRKALEYIEKNLGSSFAITDVVRFVGISYEHLHRCFRRDMNMTITEYTNRARIHRVEHYIIADNMTLADAGKLAGIQDVKYLSRLFHRYVGISAAEYRRIYGGRGK